MDNISLIDRVAKVILEIDHSTHKTGAMTESEARELAFAAIMTNAETPQMGDVMKAVVIRAKQLKVAISKPVDMSMAIYRVFQEQRNARLDKLITVISGMNPHGKDPDLALKVYDVMWAAICHQTDRAARFYDGDTPEANLYRELGYVFFRYGEGL